MEAKELIELLSKMKELGYRHLRIEREGFLLEVDSGGLQAGAATTAAASSAPQAAAPAAAAPAATAAPPAPAADRLAGAVAVKAPMIGTFYRAPAPGAAPFVEVGSCVAADDTVCIIEVMKLFNSIPAGVAGTVVDIPLANEASVEAGEAVIWIRPA